MNYIGKRNSARILSDAYGKGVVRGQVENTNLRAYARDDDVTAAECIRTSETDVFYGREYVDVIERLNDAGGATRKVQFAEIDMRNPRRRKVSLRDVSSLYGMRPHTIPELWYLSPYEFAANWQVVMATYPTCRGSEETSQYHCRLTESGRAKVQNNAGSSTGPDMVAGADYAVIDDGGDHWYAFPDTPGCSVLRHQWVLVRRRRPVAPSFFGSPIPKAKPGEMERTARLIMSYFHPWTLRESDADEHVPFAGNLRKSGESWDNALRTWLDGRVLTKESARHVGNFMSVYRVRPRDSTEEMQASDEDVSDEELVLDVEDLEEVLQTRIGGREQDLGKDGNVESDPDEDDEDDAGKKKLAPKKFGRRHGEGSGDVGSAK